MPTVKTANLGGPTTPYGEDAVDSKSFFVAMRQCIEQNFRPSVVRTLEPTQALDLKALSLCGFTSGNLHWHGA